ncbi:hypothetical protein ASPWEDRAFT_43295 [Aspergillus wentii DTO 134E9]|uniref:ferric-chelate reductase (NADPH) n=1 Tax=Aspergillus wentii DTO 134E9 TaxID=1073089 RepID=A0A1L9RE66_ASPWE|nr:uncharacterized protein ASPWEDRAFT_43295 [Aspergillus wentii DTO 134E9]OJJ33220.1 hypothetical protein ASPWEDRAFT_43295 [Aspergillus wentii DTO 134E9]
MDSGSSMDMAMSEKTVGLPWLDQPVMLHSSRADSCSKFTSEQCAYRNYHWRYWYESDHVYALNTIYFLCATVGVFAIAHFLSKYAPVSLKKSGAWRKATATMRYLAYKGFRMPALRYWSPSLGVILLGVVGTVFFFAMILGPKPYYWPTDQGVSYGSSPPIATRTGWMALALLPFVMALGAKANLISALTGVPHEKLQVFHHWTSYAMFVLALIHTFPFIIYHINKGDMVEEWNTSVVYWTGVAAIIPQAYLTFMSLPSIRNRFYEFFKATHFLAALLFLIFFFFHCDFRLSSWDYFVATGTVYLLSLFAAQIRTYLLHGVHYASIDLLPCGFVRVKIPTIISWRPGQHIFVRFFTLGLHSLTAHPFTICSLSYDPDKVGKASEIVFYIKPRRGITGRLAKIAAKSPGASKKVVLEGPYGGMTPTALAEFDKILVISGGSGGGFSLAIIEEALRLRQFPVDKQNVDSGAQRQHIHVIFATRNTAVAEWYIEAIEAMISTYDAAKEVSVSVHITSQAESSNQTTSDPANDGSKELPKPDITSVSVHNKFRPNLPQIIASATNGETGKHVGVFVCGPSSMLHDTRNAAAEAQRDVLKGNVEDVYLHTESFS